MSWSYDLSQIGTTPRYQVRRMIGDVLQNDQQLADEEIDYYLTTRSSVYGAAAECCRAIAANYSRRANTSVTGMSVQFNSQSREYAQRAIEFEAQAAIRGGGTPYAGGISQADKETREQDTDRTEPQFTVGMDDNFLLPGGSAVGPQTTTNQQD